MAFCTNCGSQLSDDDLFCPNCGTKVLVENSVKKEVPQIQENNDTKKEIVSEEHLVNNINSENTSKQDSTEEPYEIHDSDESLQLAFITGKKDFENDYNIKEKRIFKMFQFFSKNPSEDIYGFNWIAMIFGPCYLSNRRCYKASIITWIIQIVMMLLSLLIDNEIFEPFSVVATLGFFVLMGLLSDYMVYKKYKEVVYKTYLESTYYNYSKEQVLEKISDSGGTDMATAIWQLILTVVIPIFIIIKFC